MSKQPQRYAVIEVVEAETVWPADKPVPARSKRPHFLRLRASNGAILAVSETYDSLGNANRATGDWVDAFRGILAAPDSERVREVTS